MGEYAKRIKDGANVKIGTCEALYYLRWEQRNEVVYNFTPQGKHIEWLWRIPSMLEDGILPGDFEYGGLLQKGEYIPYCLSLKPFDKETSDALAQTVGLVQQRVEKLGMLINMPCYHGLKLPEAEGFGFFWNGKREAIHLCYLINKEHELEVGIKCNACGKMWSAPFPELQPFIKSLWMRLRLLHQCSEYWDEHNKTTCPYSLTDKDYAGRPMKIYYNEGEWHVEVKGLTFSEGNWDKARDAFISQLGEPNDDWGKLGHEEWSYYSEIRDMKKRYLHYSK